MVHKGCLCFIGLCLFAAFLFGIFLLVPFPIALFPKIVKSQLYLRENDDGSYPTSTHYWSQLPVNAIYNFYFFNITNQDEVMYEGQMPSFVQVGPYSYKEWEFKEEVRFFDNGNQVYFKNNKSYAFQSDTSCPTCTYQDQVTVPNAAYMAVVALIEKNKNTPGVNIKMNALILDILCTLLGEQPIRTVPMAGVLFNSYNDPFISLINSKLTQLLTGLMGGTFLGMQIPPIKYMGYFPKYNHSADEDYIAYTGKSNADQMAQISHWAGNTSLDWWGDSYSRDLKGSGDGTFFKPQLKTSDELKMYQSYACRAYHMSYSDSSTVSGIKAYIYKINSDDYDATSHKNKGYRYENTEKADYFPNWPCGPNHTSDPLQPRCGQIDCSLRQNLCDTCCNGSHYGNTVFLPPGMVPLRCLPGQKIRVPFGAFLSPPHFLGSPPEVIDSMRGIQPDADKHEAAKFYINPLTGSTLRAYFRMQLSIPYYNSPSFMYLGHLKSAFAPSFWVDIHIELKDYAHKYLKFNTTTLPAIILGVGIGLVIIPLIGMLASLLIVLRRRRRQSVMQVKSTDETLDWAT